MSEKGKHQHNRAPQKKAPTLSPEEQAKWLAARQQAQADAKVEQERVELYGKSVQHMSHRQLRGELVRGIKREYSGKPPAPNAGLTIAFSTILLAVLDNTVTHPQFEKGRYARPDQFNPKSKRTMNPGW